MAFLLQKCEAEKDFKNPRMPHGGTGAFFPLLLSVKMPQYLIYKARNTKTSRVKLANASQILAVLLAHNK